MKRLIFIPLMAFIGAIALAGTCQKSDDLAPQNETKSANVALNSG